MKRLALAAGLLLLTAPLTACSDSADSCDAAARLVATRTTRPAAKPTAAKTSARPALAKPSSTKASPAATVTVTKSAKPKTKHHHHDCD